MLEGQVLENGSNQVIFQWEKKSQCFNKIDIQKIELDIDFDKYLEEARAVLDLKLKEKYLRLSLESFPKSSDNKLYYARLLVHLGRYAEAEALLQKTNTPEAGILKALVRFRRGRNAEARHLLLWRSLNGLSNPARSLYYAVKSIVDHAEDREDEARGALLLAGAYADIARDDGFFLISGADPKSFLRELEDAASRQGKGLNATAVLSDFREKLERAPEGEIALFDAEIKASELFAGRLALLDAQDSLDRRQIERARNLLGQSLSVLGTIPPVAEIESLLDFPNAKLECRQTAGAFQFLLSYPGGEDWRIRKWIKTWEFSVLDEKSQMIHRESGLGFPEKLAFRPAAPGAYRARMRLFGEKSCSTDFASGVFRFDGKK